MKLSRDDVVAFMRRRGDEEHADRAQRELPEELELPRDEGLLAQYGVESEDLDDDSEWGG